MRITMLSLPAPVPASESRLSQEAWVYRLALKARRIMISRESVGSTLTPLASVACDVAAKWCETDCRTVDDPTAAEWLKVTWRDERAVAWLAGAIVEILTLDETTQAWLRSHRLPSRSMRKGGK